MYKANDANLDSPTMIKSRDSGVTAVSEDFNQNQERFSAIVLPFENLKKISNDRFRPVVQQTQVGQKMNKKAINWLMTVCWQRAIDQECLWEAVMIYYSYKSKRIIIKTQLQKLLACCLFLAAKLISPEKISKKDIMEITNHKFSSVELTAFQNQILNALDFELLTDENYISEILHSQEILDKEEKVQFLCLAETLMIKNSQIFWKQNLTETLAKIVKEIDQFEVTQLKSELQNLADSKEGQIVWRKYASKCDTQKLLDKVYKP